MFDFIAEILAVVIRPIYSIVQNYGWTIIIFTVLIKLLTLPFTIKSQKSMAKMQQVQPLIAEVQKKYANNKEKQQQEMMKIYEKYQISPTGGCLPLLFQMIVLMGFIQIVYKPVTFILNIPKSVIEEAAKAVSLTKDQITAIASNQLNIFKYQNLLDKLEISQDSLNFDFLGIDLTKVLSGNMTDIICWILPVIALALTILSTVISQRQAVSKQNPNAKNDPQAAQTQAMSKSMYIMMPIMTIWITYSWPLGCALYWIISTLTQILQQIFVQKFIVDKMPPIELKPDKKKKPRAKIEEADFTDESEEKPEISESSKKRLPADSKRAAMLREIEEDFAPKKNAEKEPQKKNQKPKAKPEASEEKPAELKDVVKRIKNENN